MLFVMYGIMVFLFFWQRRVPRSFRFLMQILSALVIMLCLIAQGWTCDVVRRNDVTCSLLMCPFSILFVTCVICLNVFVNCLLNAIFLCQVAVLLLNVMFFLCIWVCLLLPSLQFFYSVFCLLSHYFFKCFSLCVYFVLLYEES